MTSQKINWLTITISLSETKLSQYKKNQQMQERKQKDSDMRKIRIFLNNINTVKISVNISRTKGIYSKTYISEKSLP